MEKKYTVSEYVATKRSTNTKKLVEISIKYYLLFCYPEEVNTSIDDLGLKHLQATNQADKVKEYAIYLNSQNLTPATVWQKTRQVIYWLKWNGIILKPYEIDVILAMLPRHTHVHEEHILTPQDIKSLLAHADPLMRALILLLVSSGMRIGEALHLELSDLRSGNQPAAHIPRERMKAGKAHTYYYSHEAAEAIAEWLKVREEYLVTAETKARLCLKHAVNGDDRRVFPLSDATARVKFSGILKAANLYEVCRESRRTTITFHGFRKYAESTMKLYIPINVANELIGHDEGLSKSYRRYGEDQLIEAYQKAEPHLTIQTPADYADLKGRTASAIQEQRETTAALAAEVVRMRAELEDIRAFMRATD